MPIPAGPPKNLPGVEAGGEDDEEMERADAEVRQFPDHVLRDKMLRAENAIKSGLPRRLRDGGKRLRLSLDAIRRELSRRELLSEAGAEEDEEKERADAELRQFPDYVLRDKMLRAEKAIKAGLPGRLRDGGKKLRASLDAIHRELARRGAPHPPGGSGRGARVQDGKGCERIVRSRCAESSGTGPRAYVSRRVTLCSVLKAIKGSEAIFRSVGCGVPDRFAMEVYAEAPWRGIPGNVRCLKAMSGLCHSVEEAQESAANNLVAILQKEYGVVVDDFNYAALCMEGEKKKGYRAAAKAFESGWKQTLDDMESMQEKCEEICVDAMADFPLSDVTSSSLSLVEWSGARLWEGLAYHEEFKQKYV